MVFSAEIDAVFTQTPLGFRSEEINTTLVGSPRFAFSDEINTTIASAPLFAFSDELAANFHYDLTTRTTRPQPSISRITATVARLQAGLANIVGSVVSTESLYDDAVTELSALGDVRGPQVADLSIDERNLKPIVALWVPMARLAGSGPSLSFVVPASKPEPEEVLWWEVVATATVDGPFSVKLGDTVLVTADLTAGQSIMAEGFIARLDTAPAPLAVVCSMWVSTRG